MKFDYTFITGLMFGFEIFPSDDFLETNGGFIFDLGIFRIVAEYK